MRYQRFALREIVKSSHLIKRVCCYELPETPGHIGEHVPVGVQGERGEQLGEHPARRERACAARAPRKVAQSSRQLVQRVRRLLRNMAGPFCFLETGENFEAHQMAQYHSFYIF